MKWSTFAPLGRASGWCSSRTRARCTKGHIGEESWDLFPKEQQGDAAYEVAVV